MPAIDFPTAPAVNDEYTFEGRTWLWNGTGWEVKAFVAPAGATGPQGATGAAAFSSASNAPTSPLEGDEWLDEDTGIRYTYVIDADSSQWVELGPRTAGFIGATGPAGVTGPTGPQGPTGPYEYTITTTAISKTLANRERCTVTAAGLTITLPASPLAGWEVAITVAGTFTDTIVARNGVNIMSLAENITIDKADVSVTLYYVDATRGWRII